MGLNELFVEVEAGCGIPIRLGFLHRQEFPVYIGRGVLAGNDVDILDGMLFAVCLYRLIVCGPPQAAQVLFTGTVEGHDGNDLSGPNIHSARRCRSEAGFPMGGKPAIFLVYCATLADTGPFFRVLRSTFLSSYRSHYVGGIEEIAEFEAGERPKQVHVHLHAFQVSLLPRLFENLEDGIGKPALAIAGIYEACQEGVHIARLFAEVVCQFPQFNDLFAGSQGFVRFKILIHSKNHLLCYVLRMPGCERRSA